MSSQVQPVLRRAARILLIDDEGRILLFKAQLAGSPFWITPGGGLADGESHEEAALRELWEETGLSGDIGALTWVWVRSHTFDYREHTYDQRERYYLLRSESGPAITYENWEEEERTDLIEHRWWRVEDILASDEVFAPRRLGELLHQLLRDGPPAEPVDASG